MKTIAYLDKVIKGDYQIANDILEDLKSWLVNHIQVTDRKYIDYFKRNSLKWIVKKPASIIIRPKPRFACYVVVHPIYQAANFVLKRISQLLYCGRKKVLKMTATGVEKTFEHNLKLDSGSSVAVIGSGPAGSFFSFIPSGTGWKGWIEYQRGYLW